MLKIDISAIMFTEGEYKCRMSFADLPPEPTANNNSNSNNNNNNNVNVNNNNNLTTPGVPESRIITVVAYGSSGVSEEIPLNTPQDEEDMDEFDVGHHLVHHY